MKTAVITIKTYTLCNRLHDDLLFSEVRSEYFIPLLKLVLELGLACCIVLLLFLELHSTCFILLHKLQKQESKKTKRQLGTIQRHFDEKQTNEKREQTKELPKRKQQQRQNNNSNEWAILCNLSSFYWLLAAAFQAYQCMTVSVLCWWFVDFFCFAKVRGQQR